MVLQVYYRKWDSTIKKKTCIGKNLLWKSIWNKRKQCFKNQASTILYQYILFKTCSEKIGILLTKHFFAFNFQNNVISLFFSYNFYM